MRTPHLIAGAALAAIGLLVSVVAQAEPTDITVRVLARDAKFIGTHTGGARITIQDADTGKVLAQGLTQGGTGNTERIMQEAHQRGAGLATEDTAKFDATIDIDEPTRVRVTAETPMDEGTEGIAVSAEQWVVPGKDLTGGDGWVLEMPGFIVSIEDAPTKVMLKGGSATIPLKAKITMMCGCPITPGGLWDANSYEVSAIIKRDGQAAGESTLTYAGQASQFAGSYTVDKPGTYLATVYAYDPATGNTGVGKVQFTVSAQ